MLLLSGDKIAKPKINGSLGIRSMRQSNAATLAKIGWRMMLEPQSLWSRVLRGKYCHNRLDIDMFQPFQRSSHTWKGVIHGAQILSKGLCMAIGNGSSTLFWFHSWLLDTPLLDFASQPVPEDFLGATVSECWTDNGWNWVLLTPYLPGNILSKLLTVRLNVRADAVDKPFWNFTSSGLFTTRSAMSLLQEPDQSDNNPIWRLIWKIPVQQRAHILSISWPGTV